MRLFRLPFFARYLYPEAIFRIKTTEKVLYLTFDDGPYQESTPVLLKILLKHGIKSTFFCNGSHAGKLPAHMDQIRSEGHLIGNHGYSHMKGWYSATDEYIADVEAAARFTSDRLFRPPFGMIKKSQYNLLKKKYTIYFWDLMPCDFDLSFGAENTLKILEKKIRPGSVIVMHDKTSSCANEIIEEFIVFAKNKGYRFELPFQD